ncbi:MAG: c-type cytochrome [Azoarcus sp.]|jgi:CxxC motif-containing protein (DUF1111 family)|nr:c-type cytochrome [Azoarcus sp.]
MKKEGIAMKIAPFLLSTLLAPAAFAQTAALPSASDDFVAAVDGRAAYQQIPWRKLPESSWTRIRNGRSLTRLTWVIAPSLETQTAGLGPTYNRPSCLSCHPGNGRGAAPANPDAAMHSMLVRLSVPGEGPHGGPKPEPRYGDQLNEFGIPGVPGEGEAFLTWHTRAERLDDGTSVELRWPTVGFRHLGYGPLSPKLLTSPRIAPPTFGLGLLEAVPEADILAIAAAQKAAGDGVAGAPNRVWESRDKRHVMGRFGWKANQPTVRQQIAGALAGDMGVTSDASPEPNCPPVQTACAAVRKKLGEKHPEITPADLDDMALYHHVLSVPLPRGQDDPKVSRGEALFATAGCVTCHQPTLRTGPFPALPALAGRTIHPYTDLLLHDMGEDLADNRPDFKANGRQWRTPPLWGIGLSETVAGDEVGFLHDGRARNLLEAILWHGGEGEKAKQAVRAMPAADREALLAFLKSL